MEYNIYCDESCHLENDGINSMVIGAVWCPKDKLKEINDRISKIKEKYRVLKQSELKWVKVAPVKLDLYKEIVNYFFDCSDLHFRCVIVPDKNKLDHKKFEQTHDDWYYKMYFEMLKVIFNPQDKYNVYVDIKDSHSYEKTTNLKKICNNSMYDFSGNVVKKIQPIRSHETQIMQIVDILIGAICYANRDFDENFKNSTAKLELIRLIKERSNYQLNKTTLYREDKLNMLLWSAR
ncbi:DUF3800 domain-containing protein [Gallibacter intestinalis]|uniref:DUF3800 domain-containing protein n=1 Tax=Gallibacter intestinalis TaxID=2779356 RepID=A0ABR9QY79_9FIRM|nr:DUF3800 domain-containing protein [Gallibacter intestinalis]MBE5035801.1 DUF3800 domain-containing protein [Gallibacter intestinalis]